jgi:hypothetical protein
MARLGDHGRRLRRPLAGVDLPCLRLAAEAACDPKQAERPLGLVRQQSIQFSSPLPLAGEGAKKPFDHAN